MIIGGGGREHALSWMIKKSPLCSELFIVPGNAGTHQLGENININHTDFNTLEKVIIEKQVNFVIVGPEDPIVKGIEDFFSKSEKLKHIPLLAPSSEGAMLEGSKDYAKRFMKKYDIPTAAYKSFTTSEYEEARKYISDNSIPIVIKADGLAAGKGVTVAFSEEEAQAALDDIFINNKFGKAGEKVVIEQFLDGIELSVFVLTDGLNYILLPEAKDYKQIGEGNKGPNTGGMGAVSPVPFADAAFMKKVTERIVEPTINALIKEKIRYRGFVFFGLMKVGDAPYVIEYNVRLGDPEAEVILPRIDEDIVPVLLAAAQGNLEQKTVKIRKECSVTVMLVSGGYPDVYEKNKVITGIDKLDDVNLFVAGAQYVNNEVQSTGGRVLAVNALSDNLKDTVEKVYKQIEKISFDKMRFRKDIGKDILNLL